MSSPHERWLSEWHPLQMLDAWQDYYGDGFLQEYERKLHLFMCACARSCWLSLPQKGWSSTISVERTIEAGGTFPQWPDPAGMARTEVPIYESVGLPLASQADILRDIAGCPLERQRYQVVKGHLCQLQAREETPEPRKRGYVSSVFVRERWQHVPWLTPEIRAIARAAYEERDSAPCHCVERRPLGSLFSERQCCAGTGMYTTGTLARTNLAVLADALTDAGLGPDPCSLCNGRKGTMMIKTRTIWSEERTEDVPGSEHFVPCFTCQGDGVQHNPLVAHLLEEKSHYRGCWVLDLLLEKTK